jgi:hypothetical protein
LSHTVHARVAGMKDLALKPHPNLLARHSPPRQSSSLNNCFVWHAETFGPRLRSNARVASQRQSIFVLFPLGYLWRGSEAGSRHSKVKIRTAIPVIAGSQAPLRAVRSGFEALMTAPMSGEVTAASILTSKAVVLCRREISEVAGHR